MKKKQDTSHNKNDIEIIKAVAQAWHGHSTKSAAGSASEFDTHRRNFRSRPSRFKLEAMNMALKRDQCSSSWDFRESLWDPYEIVAVAKKLEVGLVFDDRFSTLDEPGAFVKRQKESKSSLRKLLKMVSSKRFSEDDIPIER